MEDIQLITKWVGDVSLDDNLYEFTRTTESSGEIMAYWMYQLPRELRDMIYRDTYDLLIADLEKRAATGIYTQGVASTNLLCERTHAAFAEIAEIRLDGRIVNESRALWLAEYWPRVCKLKFHFSRVHDYITYHLPFATIHQVDLGESEIVVENVQSLPAKHQVHEDPIYDESCHCSEVCKFIAFLHREFDASTGQWPRNLGDPNRYCEGRYDLQHEIKVWWRPEGPRWWFRKFHMPCYREHPGLPVKQVLAIRDERFMVEEAKLDGNGQVRKIRVRGPLALLNWAEYDGPRAVMGAGKAKLGWTLNITDSKGGLLY